MKKNKITSVNQQLFVKKLLRNKRNDAVLILVLVIISFIFLLVFGPLSFPFVIIFYFILFKGLEDYIKHRELMQKFASDNNLTYLDKTLSNPPTGRLFNIGRLNESSNVMSGKFDKYPITIFNYQYTIGSGGNNSRTYNFTVCELSIDNIKFPHIFLKSRSMMRHFLQKNFGKDKDVEIKLDTKFNKIFKLYCTQDYEIEALQIFTQDILETLISKAPEFSIEFSDNRIYFYDNKVMSKRKELDVLYGIVKEVLTSSGESISRLHDDFTAMHSFYKK